MEKEQILGKGNLKKVARAKGKFIDDQTLTQMLKFRAKGLRVTEASEEETTGLLSAYVNRSTRVLLMLFKLVCTFWCLLGPWAYLAFVSFVFLKREFNRIVFIKFLVGWCV